MGVTHLITGLALDRRLLEKLELPPERFRCWDLLPPLPRETLPQYALRMAKSMGFRPEDAVGGVSLGGMVALEIARQRGASRVVLLSSCTHPRFIRPAFRVAGRLARFTPQPVLRAVFRNIPTALRKLGMHNPGGEAFLREVMGNFPPAMLQRLPGMILDWKGCEPTVPYSALHSERDWLIRPPLHLKNLKLLPGNAHLLTIPRPREVREFLLAAEAAN